MGGGADRAAGPAGRHTTVQEHPAHAALGAGAEVDSAAWSGHHNAFDAASAARASTNCPWQWGRDPGPLDSL